jgi:hypothetical protein
MAGNGKQELGKTDTEQQHRTGVHGLPKPATNENKYRWPQQFFLWILLLPPHRQLGKISVCLTLQTKSDFYIPRNETARPRSQFPHACIRERFIYSLDRST